MFNRPRVSSNGTVLACAGAKPAPLINTNTAPDDAAERGGTIWTPFPPQAGRPPSAGFGAGVAIA